VYVQTKGDRVVLARLVIGSVARGPLSIASVEKTLQNTFVGNEQAISEAAMDAMNTCEAFIANNMTQPVEYRTKMVSVVSKRALIRASKRAVSQTGLSEGK
ncbi:MAG: hypothetical protein ACP5U1_09790, partial [Desulfomonilaceae bacterium]